MKKLFCVLLAVMMITFGCTACSSSGTSTASTTVEGVLKAFSGSLLTIDTTSGEELILDVSKATINRTNGMLAGDDIVVTYTGSLSGTDTSKIEVISVDDKTTPDNQVESSTTETVVSGTLIDATMNTVVINTGSEELTFTTVNAEMDIEDGLIIGNQLFITYTGEIHDGDTSDIHVIRVVDNETNAKSTPTPTASAAPQPMNTADIKVHENEDWMYLIEDAYVYRGNSLKSAKIGKLYNNQGITTTGYTDDGWIRVSFNGTNAYVQAKSLSNTYKGPTAAPTAAPQTNAPTTAPTPVPTTAAPTPAPTPVPTPECGGHGHMTEAGGQGVCVCDEGYEDVGGFVCAKSAPTPEPTPDCGANGMYSPVSGTCTCVNGYSGDKCDIAPTPTPDCGANGSFSQSTQGCVCVNGYTGPNCEVAPTPEPTATPEPPAPVTVTASGPATPTTYNVFEGYVVSASMNVITVDINGKNFSFDPGDASQYFTNGIKIGNLLSVSYTGDLDLGDPTSITVEAITDSALNDGEPHLEGTIVGTTANTVTLTTDDGATMTFMMDDTIDNRCANPLAAGMNVVVHVNYNEEVTTDSTNIYPIDIIADAA